MSKKSPLSCYEALLSLLLQNLEGAVRDNYASFHCVHKDLFLDMPASTKHHHSFVGGYAVHIHEVMDNLLRLVQTFGAKGFTKQDAVVSAYVHDLDKLFWRYQRDPEAPTDAQLNYARSLGIKIEGQSKTIISQQIDAKKNGKVFNIDEVPQHVARQDYPFMDDSAAVATLMQEHKLPGWNRVVAEAVSLHHGGWAPLAKADTKHAAFPPLAVLLHSADLISAQIQNGEQA
jgi:hypothetical protein